MQTQNLEESKTCCSNKYFTPAQWIIFTILIVLGLVLRWTMLDMRPYHHDESLHGMYGRYFYDFPDFNYYKYDPMLHGPMLYNTMRLIYSTFGFSDWAARTPVAIMGSFLMFVPWLFRRFFKPVTILALTAAITISPTMTYWARFLREDSWVVTAMIMVLFGLFLSDRRWRAFWITIGFTLQWCTKINVLVHLAIIVGFLVFEAGFNSFILKEKDSYLARVFKQLRTYPWEAALGVVFAAFIYCWFYGAGFRYIPGIWEGLYKGIQYWVDQNGKERIVGPFMFHFYNLSWYELPWVVAYLFQMYLFYRSARKETVFLGAATLIIAGILYWSLPSTYDAIANYPVFKTLHIKNRFDVMGCIVMLFNALAMTIEHLLRREKVLAASAYIFTATLFTYSYLGEKVPWLSMYPFLTGLAYFGFYFENYFSKNPIDYRNFSLSKAVTFIGWTFTILSVFFMIEEYDQWKWQFAGNPVLYDNSLMLSLGLAFLALGYAADHYKFLGVFNLRTALFVLVLVYNLRATVQTNFVYAGKETEYLSQVHTTYELAEVANRIKSEINYEKSNYRPKILVTGEATWPLAWYFRDVPEYKFSATEEEKKDFTYIFQDYKETPAPGEIPEGYYARKLNLRGWWVPDFNQITLKKFLNYSINHTGWSGTGFSICTLLTLKDTSRLKK